MPAPDGSDRSTDAGAAPDPAVLAARIPGCDPRRTRVVPLTGGLTNRNLHLQPSDGTPGWVLRLPGDGTRLLGIDRELELLAARSAADAGVGPAVITLLRPEGCLVTSFIRGVPVPPDALRSGSALPRVAAALRAIHASAPVPGLFLPLRIVALYGTLAAARGVRAPVPAGRLAEVAGTLEAALAAAPVPLRLCHNDLLNANLIDDGTRIRIVDWEYAAMGDPWFDLGNLAVNHDLDADAEVALLAAWRGRPPRPSEVARLRLMRVASDLREGMWGVLQSAVSDLGMDFRAYAAEHLERALAAAATPGYRAALAALADASGPADDGLPG